MKKTTEKYIWNTENKKIQEIWNEQCFKCEKRTIWSTKNRMEWYNECWITTKEKQNTKFNNNREKKKHIKQNGRKLAKAAKTTNTQIDEEVTPKRSEEPRKWNVFCLFKSIVSNENPFFYSLLLCVCVFAFGVFCFWIFTSLYLVILRRWAELSWVGCAHWWFHMQNPLATIWYRWLVQLSNQHSIFLHSFFLFDIFHHLFVYIHLSIHFAMET